MCLENYVDIYNTLLPFCFQAPPALNETLAQDNMNAKIKLHIVKTVL